MDKKKPFGGYPKGFLILETNLEKLGVEIIFCEKKNDIFGRLRAKKSFLAVNQFFLQ